MIDPAGGGSSSQAAAEAARRAAEEARRRQLEEARRQAAEQAAQARRDQMLTANQGGIFASSARVTATNATATGATYTVNEAARLSAWIDPAQGGEPVPPGRDHVPVTVGTQGEPAALTDDWIRASKAQIGMGSTAVYDAYMSRNGGGLEQMAWVLAPETAPAPGAMYDAGNTGGYVNLLVRPALDAMADLHPEASFELLTVESGAAGESFPHGHEIYAPLTVIRMTESGETQDYVVDPGMLFAPTDTPEVHAALVATPGGLDVWHQAVEPVVGPHGFGEADPQAQWDRLADLPGAGPHHITLGILTMDPATQAAFLQQYGQGHHAPLGVLRAVDTVPPDQVLLTVDATGLARGEDPETFATTVHNAAIDGLAGSTALPPIGDVSQQDWRATLDQLAIDPPADMAGLRSELTRLTGGTITAAQLDELAIADANALPALLNLVQHHPPEVGFDGALNLSIVAASGGVPATYESLTYDPLANVVVVDTSLNHFVDDAEAARLSETYGVGDVPMTIRIPLPAGAPTDWSNPDSEQITLLNEQIETIGQTSVFLHGFQSDRRVWESDMQRWMDLSAEPTIGIAMAGMGSEGDFLGSGASPLTAKQYAFHTMEALDALGLYGKELNLYGHSMGGAAVLQVGLATDRMVGAGADRPDVNYVLLEPAPTGDSVPFLTEGFLSGVINAQTNAGAAGWLGNIGAQVTNWVGSGVVLDHLIPGAPEYIQDVHEGFPTSGGFDQLKATGQGLVLQAEPDPAEVQAFLAGNHVLVVAGSQDRIVSTEAVQGLFDGQVFEVPGNHYAHLPSEIAEQNHFGDVEQRVREFLAEPPPAPAGPPPGPARMRYIR